MAYQFTIGSNQLLSTSSAPASEYPVTMACQYLNLSSHTGVMISLNASANPFHRMSLECKNNNTVAAVIRGSGNAEAVSAPGITGVWQHAAATFASSSSRRAFYNGVGGSENNITSTTSGINETLIATRRASGALGSYFNGQLAEAAIWSTVLTDSEILSLARGFTPDQIRPQSLVFYAPLTRNLQDLRGGLAITATNGPTVVAHPRVIQ